MTFLFDMGDRVEAMLESGRKIMCDAIDEHKPVAIFAGFSGGNDSIVATHFACTEFGAQAIHCNTMTGVQLTRQHVVDVCERQGWSLMEKHAIATGPPRKRRDGTRFDPATLPCGKWNDAETAYEEFCINFGMPGPGQHARMYQRLKERLFESFKREAKQGHGKRSRVMFITGIRGDESTIRAGYKAAVDRRGGSVWVNPFYWQTAFDFELYRQEFGLPRNKVSDRIGFSGECLCGTMGSPEELDAVAEVEPEAAAKIHAIEERCRSYGLPCKWATAPAGRPKFLEGQQELFGDEPTFQPACVGCIRRQAASVGVDN